MVWDDGDRSCTCRMETVMKIRRAKSFQSSLNVTYRLRNEIVTRRSVNEIRPTRGLHVFHVTAVDDGRDVRHAVDQRTGGDLGGLLSEPAVADLNESGGRRLGRAHGLVPRLIVNVRRCVRGIVQRVCRRMVSDVFQLDRLADVLGLGRLTDGRPTCRKKPEKNLF